MLPTEADEVEVDGCGVFEGRVRTEQQTSKRIVDRYAS